MEKLDRLGWTEGFAVSAYGAKVGVRYNDPSVTDRLLALLPPGTKMSDDPVVDSLLSLRIGRTAKDGRRRHYHLLYEGVSRVLRTFDLDEVFYIYENLVTLAVAYFAQPDRVFVHAGVVGWQGKAIVIPGRSHAGKTTMVTALLRAGATYYSDDMAILDDEGRVHPFPVALGIRNGGERRLVRPDEMGHEAATEPLPVGLVAVTRFEEGSRWQPERLSPGRAVLALMDHTVRARRDPEAYLPVLRRVAVSARTLQGNRGDADETARDLLEELAANGIQPANDLPA